VLVLLSLLALSLENVVVTAIFHKSPILGVRELGGLITPSVSSALLLLWLRMLVIVPLMSLVAPRLYSAVWRDLKKLIQSPDWSLCGSVLGSGFCLFLSQVLIYWALGTILPGVAVTIFFIYPIAILFWKLGGFRRYPNPTIRWALLSILVGVLVSIFNSSIPGSLAAAVAGIAFACHMILMQNCRSKLNPTPMRWIHSVIILFFSTLGLLFLPKSWSTNLEIDTFTGLIIGVALGGAALVSYLLDRTSHKMLPVATASMLGATVPVLTAFLGFVLLQTVMSPAQIFGTLLVSLGVAALSFRGKMRSPQAKMGR
ncbi:MAG: DMT family transporter, partial [Symploca sp. SIO1A3]|nr:DMT family transporter [Symploca sp. SIO1A3]